MIGYIKGTIEGILTDSLLLDNQGIGYRIFTSGRVIDELSQNQQVKLFTYLHVREDELSLFGFTTSEELDAFRLLIGVNGIGPKAALSILSVLSVQDLALAVMSGDTKAISKANGVGPKGASRVIMELKDKLKIENLFMSEDVSGADIENTMSSSVSTDSTKDTVLALVSLGYSEMEALKAIKQIKDAEFMNSEELLKAALKKMF